MRLQGIMAKRMALIPEELISSYQLQKPEIRIEDDIEALLEKAKLPDDMKVKLLGQLITRYHKTVHAPPDPVRVTFANDESKEIQSNEATTNEIQNDKDTVLKDILVSSLHSYAKYVPAILEKLKSRQYAWNEKGEMTIDGNPIAGSRIVDFFHYVTRNNKTVKEPKYFNFFLKALQEINVPRSWIPNKKAKSRLEKPIENSREEEEPEVFKSSMKRSRSSVELASPQLYREWRARSALSPDEQWLTY